MNDTCHIRLAAPTDAEALLEIFRPYVLETAVVFDYEPPSCDAFRDTIVNRLRRYPYWVAETNGTPSASLQLPDGVFSSLLQLFTDIFHADIHSSCDTILC